MNAMEELSSALNFYQIEILSVAGNHVKVQHEFEIEIEKNGLYKLFHEGFVIAPFNDINELCRFILEAGSGDIH